MKSPNFRLFLLAALTLAALGAAAEKADRNKALNVEADLLRHDEVKQLSIFSGRVVMTKGTILIRGAKVELREDAQGHQYGVVSAEPGQLAFFRQKREGLDEYFEGEGETIQYDGRADTATISGRAQLRRYRGATLADEFHGAVILYNNTSEVFAVDGGPAGSAGAAPDRRMRATFGPKPGVAASAADAPAAATPALRPSSSLAGDRK